MNGALGRFCSDYLGYDDLTKTATESGVGATTVTVDNEGTGQQGIVTVIRTQTEGNVITRTSTPTVRCVTSRFLREQTDSHSYRKFSHRLSW